MHKKAYKNRKYKTVKKQYLQTKIKFISETSTRMAWMTVGVAVTFTVAVSEWNFDRIVAINIDQIIIQIINPDSNSWSIE